METPVPLQPPAPGVARGSERGAQAEISAPHLFLVRIVLRATAPASLHAHQGAMLYALLSYAASEVSGSPAALPDGLLLVAPEQGRVRLERGDTFAFGFTLLDEDAPTAERRLARLVEGLRLIGVRGKSRAWGLRGNFEVDVVEDLVAGRTWTGPGARGLQPLDPEWIASEVRHLAGRNLLTLRFLTPVRVRLPGSAAGGRQFSDGAQFAAQRFVRRLRARLEDLGYLPAPPHGAPGEGGSVEVLENRLVWLDLPYGHENRRKALGGAMGRIRLRVEDELDRRALVLGQYLRAGESTRFGLGRYRIEEAGPEPFACARSAGLLELALNDTAIDRAAARFDLASGSLRQAARALREGIYVPGTVARVPLTVPGKRTRTLAIPCLVDRALQRLVHERLTPGLDLLFETSSLAYRRGLGRQTAARRIADAYAQGYRYALRSDVHRFFDSVRHDVLEDRLLAYVGDDRLVSTIMRWVRAGAPEEGRGLPTGSTLSPLLANVVLDAFDEEVRADGGFLVRYADDFLILYRTEAEAERLHAEARDAVASLALTLNGEKTSTLDLREPFEFLGFRFERRGSWRSEAPPGPLALDALGWESARRKADDPAPRIALPGEGALPAQGPLATVLLDPEIGSLGAEASRFRARPRDGAPDLLLEPERVRELIALGPLSIEASALALLVAHDIPLHLAGPGTRGAASVLPWGGLESPEVAAAQVDAARAPHRVLAVARSLVAAKIEHHALLADATAEHETTGRELRALAARCRLAPDLGPLRGLEGSAAALWYGRLAPRLGGGHRFARRVAPDATDPVNILLNLGQTALHRTCLLAARAAGLLPSLGLLHAPRAGHAALASDLQEPFRHLVDAVVLESTHVIHPADFQPDEEGPWATRIRHGALRAFFERFHCRLARPVRQSGEEDGRTYLDHIAAQARRLREHLLDASQPFVPFLHPGVAS